MERKENEVIYCERTSKQQPFDKRLIQHIVSLIEQGVPRRDLILEYGVSRKSLSNWISRHSHAVSRTTYTLSQKRSVVRAIESGMSFREAQVAFAIRDRKTIKSWLKCFSGENTELSLGNTCAMASKSSNLSTTEHEELKAMRKALEAATLKNQALNTLIDIAEEELKIDIRKKSGARQSSK